MKIATWNVNSIRVRRERAVAWLKRHDPDVVCLQEIKCVDDDFPREPFESIGYHVETFGQKTYNGVAFLSKLPVDDVQRGFPSDGPEDQKRLIAATVGGVRIIGVYVPNGSSVDSEKFVYKLDWLKKLQAYLEDHATASEPLVLMGDFNIAPEERDVYDVEAFRGQVHFHPKEHAALQAMTNWGLSDLYRLHTEEAGNYSWWDYRQLGFPKNKGLRIDLVLGTEAITDRCVSCEIDRQERKGKKPSDHAPVVAVVDGI